MDTHLIFLGQIVRQLIHRLNGLLSSGRFLFQCFKSIVAPGSTFCSSIQKNFQMKRKQRKLIFFSYKPSQNLRYNFFELSSFTSTIFTSEQLLNSRFVLNTQNGIRIKIWVNFLLSKKGEKIAWIQNPQTHWNKFGSSPLCLSTLCRWFKRAHNFIETLYIYPILIFCKWSF